MQAGLQHKNNFPLQHNHTITTQKRIIEKNNIIQTLKIRAPEKDL